MSERPRHLTDTKDRQEVTLDSGHILTTGRGYVILIDQMHNGRWQTIAVDPADVQSLTDALNALTGGR